MEKQGKKSVKVLKPFRDINNFDASYEVGEEVDTFSEERIKVLVEGGFVDDGSAAEAEKAAKKAADDEAKRVAAEAKKAEDEAKKQQAAEAKRIQDENKRAEQEATKKAEDEAKEAADAAAKAKADADSQPKE